MPAPANLGSNRTGTPDNSTGIELPSISSQEDSDLKIIGGLELSDRIAASISADRTLSAIDTATDMSTTDFGSSDLLNINNRGAITIWTTFATAGSTASVRVVFYDSSSNPLFCSSVLSFSALTHKVSAAGNFMSLPELVETYGASKYKIYLVYKGAGNVSIFSHPI